MKYLVLTYFPCLQLLLKVQTSSMFKGKKENYPFSVCRPFMDTRISKTAELFHFIDGQHYNFGEFVLTVSSCCLQWILSLSVILFRSRRHKHQSASDDSAWAHQGKLTQEFPQQRCPFFFFYPLWPCLCPSHSTACQWWNMTGTGSGLVSGSSSSPRTLPTWSRRPRSSSG